MVTLAMVPVLQTTVAPAAADQVVMVGVLAAVAPTLVVMVLKSMEVVVELGVMGLPMLEPLPELLPLELFSLELPSGTSTASGLNG